MLYSNKTLRLLVLVQRHLRPCTVPTACANSQHPALFSFYSREARPPGKAETPKQTAKPPHRTSPTIYSHRTTAVQKYIQTWPTVFRADRQTLDTAQPVYIRESHLSNPIALRIYGPNPDPKENVRQLLTASRGFQNTSQGVRVYGPRKIRSASLHTTLSS